MISGLNLNYFVHGGQLLQAEPWNEAGRHIRTLRLIQGPGTRLRITPDGTFISFDGSNAFFDNPFRVTLNGATGAAVKQGLINNVGGMILDVPLDGDDKGTIPVMTWERLALDKDGKGWIVAEVTCSIKDWSVVSWYPRQVADLATGDGFPDKTGTASAEFGGGLPNIAPGRTFRQPLARLRQYSDGTLACFQITFANLSHRVRTDSKDAASNNAEHFCYPAG